jgi:hypothetical protein
MDVSSTSMKVAMERTTATSHGLNFRSVSADGLEKDAAVLTGL